jgi:hypothetical protein
MSRRSSVFRSTSTGFYRIKPSKFIGVLAAFFFAFGLTSCTKSPKPAASGSTPPAQLRLASAQIRAIPTGTERDVRIVLPNASLVGCNSPSCYQVLPNASSDTISDTSAVYPWQVILDFNQPAIIGLTALYDQPVTIDDVQAAVDERYGKWAKANFRTGPVRLWRVESERFSIQLSTNGNGMVQLIYLTFDARHPTSDHASARVLRECKERDNSAGFGCALMKNALAAR